MMAKSKYGMPKLEDGKTEEVELNEDGTKKKKPKSGVYFEAAIEDLKERTHKMLKKCKTNRNKIEQLDIKLYGLPQKDIDQNKKLYESSKR